MKRKWFDDPHNLVADEKIPFPPSWEDADLPHAEHTGNRFRFNQVKKIDMLASVPYQYCCEGKNLTDANENSLAVGAGLRFQLKPPAGAAPKN